MEGSTRFDLTSGSPDSNFTGNYPNGQRGYSAPALGRSSSFREGSESRKIGSGKINSRLSVNSPRDVPTLSQCLMLEPISMGDSKYGRTGDLKRVFSSFAGNNPEDNSFSSVHLKSSPTGSIEDLKRIRAGVADTCVKASGRAKKWDEHICKLNKYEASKKQQHRGDSLPTERSSGPNSKTGSQILRNPPEPSQKFDDRAKSVCLSKRLRTSMTETRAECRKNGMPRQPPLLNKDREMLKDNNNADSDIGEDKLRRLPAGGEGWDKKMKRKRSVGAVFSRSVDNEGELKRTVHNKLSTESSLQSSDSSHLFRSGVSGGSNKVDSFPSPAGSTARVSFKNDQEKTMFSKDISGGQIKERPLGKVNVKISNRDDNHAVCPTPVVKGKASRGPRTGSVAAANSSANVSHSSGTVETWEQPQPENKVSAIVGVSNRKRGMNAGSSSPPFTQWGGQRPQKISRTRRTNLVPVSNHDELPLQFDGCSPSDFGPRMSIGVGNSGPLFSRSYDNVNQNFKVKFENVTSPARHSESAESGAVESKIFDKGLIGRDLNEMNGKSCQGIAPLSVSVRQNAVVKEEAGDGGRRQGRSGRVSPFSRTSISPTREKLEPTKPLRNAKSGSDKAGSQSGRPLKKFSDRKGFSRLGHLANGASPDYSGESEDDREELLAAAHLACNSSLNACSKSAFWKSVESLFAFLGPDHKAYLFEQLKLDEEQDAGLPHNFSNGDSAELKLEDGGLEEQTTTNSSIRNICFYNGSELKDSSHQMNSLYGCPAAEEKNVKVAPLYQRVLSALILEEEIEECEETGFGRTRSSVNEAMFSGGDTKFTDGSDFTEKASGVKTWINGNARKIFPCNGNVAIDRNRVAPEHLCNGELADVHSEVEVLVRFSRCDYIPQNLLPRNGGISPFDFQYAQMSIEEKLMFELNSIGLLVENVPALDDKEEEVIRKEISQLEKLLQEQVEKKKIYLAKISSAIQEEKDIRRDPEQIAMDKLVELTYMKLLSTRGSLAVKYGVAKATKQFALAFAKRTLVRCHKYEDFGMSCFSEPALREIIFSLPPRLSEVELLPGMNPAAINGCADDSSVDGFEKNVSMLNRGKKKEVLLDDVVCGGLPRVPAALGIVGGAKGKRSERDNSNKGGVARTGRVPVGGSKGERRTKAKPKQKTSQLSTPGSAFLPKFTDATNSVYHSGSGSGESGNNSGSSKKKDVRFMSSVDPPSVSSQAMKETMEFTVNLPISDVDGMGELGVDSELGAPQDFNSWLNFDMDGLQDHDSIGLDVPMDDLSELNMF